MLVGQAFSEGKGGWLVKWVGSALVTMDTFFVYVNGGIPCNILPSPAISFAEACCWPCHCVESAGETPLN